MPNTRHNTQILHQVKAILRRDLKIEDRIEITDDMPLFGSELDLDSLDFLAVVTSIEKDLGYRIPNEDLNKGLFESVRSLATYLEPRVRNMHAGRGLDRISGGVQGGMAP